MIVTHTDITDLPFISNNPQTKQDSHKQVFHWADKRMCQKKKIKSHQTKVKYIPKDKTSFTIQENNKAKLEIPLRTVLLAEYFTYAQE